MKTELVICGVPFGTPREPQALRQVKDLGFTWVQLYTFWREYEPHGRGGFDWRALDRIVDLLRQAGLKFVPFLLMGPRYAALDALNRAWRSRCARFQEIEPFLPQRAPSRTAYFDLVAWYRDSMTRYAEFWMAECRRIFPRVPAYLCTGGGQAIFYGGPVSFRRDPEALFADPGVFPRLLGDVCAMSGVRPLGTQDDEIARARVGGRLLVLRQDEIIGRDQCTG